MLCAEHVPACAEKRKDCFLEDVQIEDGQKPCMTLIDKDENLFEQAYKCNEHAVSMGIVDF